MLRTWLAALAVLLAATPARADWIRVESPHFVLFSELNERRTRDYAREFERFREALGRAVPGAAARAAVPTLVFLFADQRSMASYRPLYNGKPVELSGYFATDGAISTIMLAASDREAALRTIFHEYSHLVTANTARGLPTWVNEGLAEYYSTFQVRADGRSALMGGLVPLHLLLLQRERLLPTDELLAVDQTSPLYNEGSRRSVFYAQSWALVHLLLNGEPDRRELFARYLQRVNSGETADGAWQAVFGTLNATRELDRYIRQSMMKGYEFKFATEIAEAAFVVSRLSPEYARAALAELRRQATPERTRDHLDAITEPSDYAEVMRALLLLERDKEADALPLLTAVVNRSTDWLVQYRAAVGLERIATSSASAASRQAAAAALQALDRVLAAHPDLPHALALRGLLLGTTDAGLASIARARQLAPGTEHYAVHHAQLLIDRGAFADARRILGPLMSPAYPPEVREHVRRMLAASVTAERARTAATPPAGTTAPAGSSGTTVYYFRQPLPGEVRITGIFEKIDCPRTGPTLHVRTSERAWTFTVEDIKAVEFIVYNASGGGAIGCGPRPAGERVHLTYRPAPAAGAVDGIAVAVEFLPADVR